jgi:hypothetical protein
MVIIPIGSNCSIAYQLNKYGLRKESYPFDWCCMNINQLIKILENDFEDFEDFTVQKLSINHMDYKEFYKPTYIITNKYGVKMAHELCNLDNLDIFRETLKRRIIRFRNINDKQEIIFIRIELKRLSQTNFENKYKKLVEILNKKFTNFNQKFKLIVITNVITNNYIFNDNIHIYNCKDLYSDDWKMEHLDWLNIFNFTK